MLPNRPPKASRPRLGEGIDDSEIGEASALESV